MKDAHPGLTREDRDRILKAIQDCIDTIDGKTNDPDAAEKHIRDQLVRIRSEVAGDGRPH